MIRTQEQRLPRGVQRLDDHEIVFRGSTSGRVWCSIWALMSASAVPLQIWLVCTNKYHDWLTASLPLFALSALAVSSWYAAGPRETALDLRRGTYRLTEGFPFTPRVRRGVMDEMAGVYIGSIHSSRHLPYYRLCLAWNQPRRRDTLLLGLTNRDVVDQIMRQTACALGLPAGQEVLDRFWFRNPRLRHWDDDALNFHKSPGVRLAWGITGKAIAVASLIFSGALVVTSRGMHFQTGNTSLGIILMDIVGLLCLRAAGPEDLEVVLRNRTYRFRYGFPYVSVERRGPIEDIIALKTDNQGNSGASRVRLVWKQPKRGDMTLGEFRSQEEADAHLRGVAARIGLKLD